MIESDQQTGNASVASRAGEQRLAVHIYESFEDASASWQALEASGTSAVYQREDWCKVWFSTFQHAASAKPLLVVLTLNAEPAMLLPLYTTPSLFGMRTAYFMGDKHANIRVPLTTLATSARSELARLAKRGTLMDSLKKAIGAGGQVDFLSLGCMPEAFGGYSNLLVEAGQCRCSDIALIGALKPNFEALCQGQRGKGYAKKMRKKVRALQAMGEVHFSQVTDRQEMRSVLDIFFQQKTKRLKAARLDNAFDLADNRDFLRRLAWQSLECKSGLLDVFTLKVGDETAAIFAGGVHDGAFSGAITSVTVDERISQKSPGEVLLHNLIEHLCEQELRWFDLGIGNARYKQAWCEPHPLRDVTLTLTSRGLLLAAADKLLHHARALVFARPGVERAARRAKFHLKQIAVRS
ncbi:MAG: GNAT family N-acetyltransferase [Devosiaceae bacterium]